MPRVSPPLDNPQQGGITLDRRLTGKEVAIAAMILIVGTLLLGSRLGNQSLWLDESLTVGPALAARDLGDLFAQVREVDSQPPASHFVLYVLRTVLPPTEFFLRLPSLVCIEGGLLLLFLLVNRLWGPTVAIPTLAMAQCSPYLGYYAAEARNYGMWFTVIMGSFFCMYQWLRSVILEDQRSYWVWALLWGTTNGIGMWLQLFHIFQIVGEGILVLLLFVRLRGPGSRKGPVSSFVFAQALAVLIFLPWVLILLSEAKTGKAGVGWSREFSLFNFAYYAFTFFFGFSLGPNLRELHVQSVSEITGSNVVPLSAAGLAIAMAGLLYVNRLRRDFRESSSRWELFPLLVYPVASLIGPICFAQATGFPLHPRHLLFAWPLLPVVLGIAWTGNKAKIAVTAIFALQLYALGNALFNDRYAKDDEKSAVSYAEKHSGAISYVLGEGGVTEFYAKRSKGRGNYFLEFDTGTEDVWLVDSRSWEPENRRKLKRLEAKLREMNFVEAGTYSQFRGILLRHWKPASSSTSSDFSEVLSSADTPPK